MKKFLNCLFNSSIIPFMLGASLLCYIAFLMAESSIMYGIACFFACIVGYMFYVDWVIIYPQRIEASKKMAALNHFRQNGANKDCSFLNDSMLIDQYLINNNIGWVIGSNSIISMADNFNTTDMYHKPIGMDLSSMNPMDHIAGSIDYNTLTGTNNSVGVYDGTLHFDGS